MMQGMRIAPVSRGKLPLRRCTLHVALWMAAMEPGCTLPFPPGDATSPFANAPAVGIDDAVPTAFADMAALGSLVQGDVLRITVLSETGRSVLVLLAEETPTQAALAVGGGAVGKPFVHAVHAPGQYYIFVLHDFTSASPERSASVTARQVALSDDPRPERQLVYIEFENGYLTDPGLWDPVDGTEADRAFLESIEPTVRGEVTRRLRDIFAETPIVITDTEPSPQDGPYSTVTFAPQRVLANQDDVNDAALPPPDPTRPECQVRVIFGEVLPRGSDIDPGNRTPDDAAVVYVGSFQGRGQTCWTSAVGSITSVVLTLAQTAAHEIGHLVGLMHVEQIDLMNRSATLAFLRDLDFARGQIQLDRLLDGRIVSEVFPAIVQDPDRYFEAVFSSTNAGK